MGNWETQGFASRNIKDIDPPYGKGITKIRHVR